MTTKENLKNAFAGESKANRKYLFFAEKAEQEGHKQIAKLFRAAAASETSHARNHLNTLKEIKNTEENLKAAFEGETFEINEMYPKFLEEAKGDEDATKTFTWAMESEKNHAQEYNKALEAIKQGKDLEETGYFVCNCCGYTHIGNKAPEKCPLCSASKEEFKEIQ